VQTGLRYGRYEPVARDRIPPGAEKPGVFDGQGYSTMLERRYGRSLNAAGSRTSGFKLAGVLSRGTRSAGIL